MRVGYRERVAREGSEARGRMEKGNSVPRCRVGGRGGWLRG